MKLYETTFFCGTNKNVEKKESPVIRLSSDYNSIWPICIEIIPNEDFVSKPKIKLFLTEQQLINFKNSLISEYELLLKGER